MAGQVYVWEEVGVLLPRYSNAFPISDNLRFSDGLRSQERVRASDLVLTIWQYFRVDYIIFQTIFRPGHLRIYSSLSFLFKDKKELKQKKKKSKKAWRKERSAFCKYALVVFLETMRNFKSKIKIWLAQNFNTIDYIRERTRMGKTRQTKNVRCINLPGDLCGNLRGEHQEYTRGST